VGGLSKHASNASKTCLLNLVLEYIILNLVVLNLVVNEGSYINLVLKFSTGI
jgi:hypothetical protein